VSSVVDAVRHGPPTGHDPASKSPLRQRSRRLDLAVELWGRVEVWVISRVALIGSILLIGSIVKAVDQPWDATSGWAAHRFASYDSGHFLRTAEFGYFSATRRCCSQAFLPGYPLSIRALSPLLGGHEIWAAMLITLVAGVVAAALLWRLAADHGGPVAGQIAVAALALNPLSVFMAVVYSEALFLVLALGAWLLARRGRWWWAGVLAALATGVRINGLFLVTALAVMFLLQLRRRQPGVHWYDGAALGLPVLVLGAYFTWLHGQTGSWTEWHDAEEKGWVRKLAAPWTGLAQGWSDMSPGGHLRLAGLADLTAVLIGLAVTVWLLVLKRWPEAVYMGLNLTVLVCSTTMVSSARYSLTWFPLYVLLGQALAAPQRRWLRVVLATVAIPFLIYCTAAWTNRTWIG
jgi:4-amino-4-deoxy-L-arabinose transferase-like glycosyltransferase